MYSTLRIILPCQMTLIYVERQLNSVSTTVELSYFFNQTPATVSFIAHFCVVTIRVCHLFLWKTRRHQWRLDKVCTSGTVTTVRCCQWSAQPHSPSCCQPWKQVVQHKHSASPLTVVCICVRVPHILAMATIRGWHLFRSELLIVPVLFEDGKSTVYVCLVLLFRLFGVIV